MLKKYGLVALHIELSHFRETHNALQLPVFFIFSFFSFFFHELIGNIGEFVAKNILQTIEQLIQFSYFSYKKDIFRVYSFLEQVAAKGNFLEAT